MPHLVVWPTEDTTPIETRKQRYTQAGAAFYHGDLHVPDDLETIDLIYLTFPIA